MFKPCILLYFEEAQFKDKIQEIAADKKVEIWFVTRGDQLSQLVKTYVPFILLVDLSGSDSGWLFRHISIIKHTNPNFPICAVIEEDQEDVQMRAEKYGCDKILIKSKLVQKLPDIIERALRKTL